MKTAGATQRACRRSHHALLITAIVAAVIMTQGLRVMAQCDVPASIGGSGGASRGVDVVGDYAFVAEHDRLTSFDISDPAHPIPVGTLFLSYNFLWDVKVSDGIAVCADAFWGVRIADVSNPAAPEYLSTYDTPYAPESVAVADGIVYAADGQSAVRVIDISNPSAPFLRASIMKSGWYVQEVIIDGTTLYFGSEAYGKVALDIVNVANPSAPVLLGTIEFTPGYPVGAGDLDVAGTVAYLSDTSAGLHAIDVSNPMSPTEIGTLSGAAGAVKAYGNRLLLGRGFSLDVVDISDPADPSAIGNLALPGRPDDIAITGATAMLSLYDAGFATLDLSNPDAPTLLGGPGAPTAAADVRLAGGLAYVADGPFGLKILDMVNPIVPLPVAVLDTPGSATGLHLEQDIAYVADGSAGLQVVDISDPLAPSLLGSADTPGNAVEIAVLDGRAYLADGTQGLRIFDVTDPTAPELLGSLTLPGVNAEATSVFLANGYVYLSDRFYGLRVVDSTDPSHPMLRSTTDTYSYANDVVVDGNIAYVADYSKRIYVMDVTNPSAPFVLWSGPQNSSATKIALDGDRLWLSQGQGGYFETYDVSNPALPVQLETVSAPTLGGGLAYYNGILVGAFGSNGLRTFQTNGLPYIYGPADVAGCPADTMTLSAAAAGQTDGGAQPLEFQWRFAGEALTDGPTGTGSIVAGANSANLTISTVSAADIGAYDCLVTNDCGPTQSAEAQLTLGGEACCSGDIDVDGIVDLGDHAMFADCFNGPNSPNPGCDAAAFARSDIDLDEDADLADFAALATLFEQTCE